MRLSAVLISLALVLPILAAPDLDLGSEKQALSTLAAPVVIAVPLLGDESARHHPSNISKYADANPSVDARSAEARCQDKTR
ncbi:hypothetical protein DFH09DRAFT_1329973 [Mycena vulgaris]|nr:hypothetical protein DFH09DRAFT_1329973 [Mycena vulgaris]